MLQFLSDHCTIEIDPSFSRRGPEDGCYYFERPGMALRTVVYCVDQYNPERAIRRYLGNSRPSEFPFHAPNDRTAGRASLERKHELWNLLAVTASLGRLFVLDFQIADQADLEIALSIWNSLRYSPPAWVVQCADASPPLAELRDAVERGIFVDRAVDGIVERGQAAHAISAMMAALEEDNVTIRKSACEALGLLGDGAEAVVTTLRKRLTDVSVEVRAWAADALIDLGEPPEITVSSMIEGLQKSEAPLPMGEARVQGVCQHLAIPDRYHAARILWCIGEAARPARGVLLQKQWDDSGCVREMVARALLNLGEPPSTVIPPLLEGLRSAIMSDRERVRIAETLQKAAAPLDEFLPTVIQVLQQSGDFTAKYYALDLIETVSRGASSAAPAIERLIRDDSDRDNLRLRAAETLRKIGVISELADAILSSESDSE